MNSFINKALGGSNSSGDEGKKSSNKAFTAIAMMAAANSDKAKVRALDKVKELEKSNNILTRQVSDITHERDEALKKLELSENENARLFAVIAEMQNELEQFKMSSISP